jgi:excisionase family DNA binding protein
MQRGRPKSDGKPPVEYGVPVEIMTAHEVAQFLKLHIETVYRFVAEGRLPFFRLGSDLRFRRKEIERWIKTQEANSSRAGGLART